MHHLIESSICAQPHRDGQSETVLRLGAGGQWQEVGIGSFEERPQLCPPHLHRSWYRGGNLSQAMIEEREVHCDPGSFCHTRDLEEVVVRDSKFQINVQLPI